MKLKKINIKNYNLIKTFLLNYQKINKELLINTISLSSLIEYAEFSLKQSLILISNYHLNNKKILFLGFNWKNKELSNLKYSKHVFLPKSLWSKGILGRKNKELKSNRFFSQLFLSKKPDLIVFFGFINENDLLILTEIKNLNIPVIVIGNIKILENDRYFNKILGSFNTIQIKNFYKFLVYSIIK